MSIIFHPHALERMQERGATRQEVRETIQRGRVSEAKFGRFAYAMTFCYAAFWNSRFYDHKEVLAYCALEGRDVIVITVVVRYF